MKQSTNHILMVSPTGFNANEEAQLDNAFMDKEEKNSPLQAILSSHATFVELLRNKGITVQVFDGMATTPDACFPNNWFVSIPGLLSLFPMKVVNRRIERRSDIIDWLCERHTGLPIDLTHYEAKNQFLEGTGSFVVDWAHGVVFAALSQRTSRQVLDDWVAQVSARLGRPPMKVVSFSGMHRACVVYHTNVLAAIGTNWAVFCLEVIVDQDRARVEQELALLGKTVIEITPSQMDSLCGNIIELDNGQTKYVVMSTRAFKAFREDQKQAFVDAGVEILHSPLDDLERIGGGGIRCCIAEIF